MKRSVSLDAIRAEIDERNQWVAAHMVPRPDPTRCCWPRCFDPKSKRYGVPLCDSHAGMIASRIENIDASRRRTKPQVHTDDEVWALRHTLNQKNAEIELLREAMPKPTKRVTLTDGMVYFVQVGGHIKIGWTSNLAKRMQAYPPNTVLLAAHPGTRKDELRLHKMFAAHRSHGREWYPLAPVILEHIKRVIAKHGQPVAVTFGAKPVAVPQPRQKQYVGGAARGRGSSPHTVRG